MAGLDVGMVCAVVDELGTGAHGVAAIRRKLAVTSGAKMPDGAWNDEVIRLLRDAVHAGALEQLGTRATFLCKFEATGAVPPTDPPLPPKKMERKKASAKRKKPAAAYMSVHDSDEDDSDAEPLVAPPPTKKAKKNKKQKVAKAKKSKNASASTAEDAPSTAEDAPSAAAADTFTPRWFWAGDKPGGMQNKWIEFDATVAARLELRWNLPRPAGKARGQLATDSERFVDLDAMMQARKDNPTRVRGVVRIATAVELAHGCAGRIGSTHPCSIRRILCTLSAPL
jgi:hypothetical protein